MKKFLLLFALAVAAMSCGDHCPSNEIWYTSADGNIVEPYSGDCCQDNFIVFGANIVSNKYDADKDCWVITFDGDVTTIAEDAFLRCSSLTSITIPDSVTTIGNGAFYNCSSLTSVFCKATTPPVGDSGMFANNASNRKIYVPMQSVAAYKSAPYWSDYADSIVGYNF